MIDGEGLFTRQQIRERTGISDDVLNYFSREGLIRPKEGGGGSGRHRFFRATEVSLAALLNEVKERAGANIGTLRAIAAAFHAAIDAVDASPFKLSVLRQTVDRLSHSPDEAPSSAGPPEVVKWLEGRDVVQLDRHIWNYVALIEVGASSGYCDGPAFLYPDSDGNWAIWASTRNAPTNVFTFIAIDIVGLLSSVWRRREGAEE